MRRMMPLSRNRTEVKLPNKVKTSATMAMMTMTTIMRMMTMMMMMKVKLQYPLVRSL